MKITIKNHAGVEYDIALYYTHTFEGKGGYMISCRAEIEDLSSKEHTTTISHYSTNSDAIDRINGLRAKGCSWDRIQRQYHSDFFEKIEVNIIDFVYKTEETEENA